MSQNPINDDPLMLLPEVEKAVRLCASTIWRKEQKGEFPPRTKVGKRAAWFRSQILAYLESLRGAGAPPAPTKANEARRRGPKEPASRLPKAA